MCSKTVCGVIHSDEFTQNDKNGCLLLEGHEGPHEFLGEDGRVWLWEVDWDCTCGHCMQCEGDYCTIYWEKPYLINFKDL